MWRQASQSLSGLVHASSAGPKPPRSRFYTRCAATGSFLSHSPSSCMSTRSMRQRFIVEIMANQSWTARRLGFSLSQQGHTDECFAEKRPQRASGTSRKRCVAMRSGGTGMAAVTAVSSEHRCRKTWMLILRSSLQDSAMFKWNASSGDLRDPHLAAECARHPT